MCKVLIKIYNKTQVLVIKIKTSWTAKIKINRKTNNLNSKKKLEMKKPSPFCHSVRTLSVPGMCINMTQ